MFSERLKQLIDVIGISITAFETSIGVSKGALAKPIKNKRAVGVEVLEKILTNYPNVNLDWLVLGIGKIFKDSKDLKPENDINDVSYNNPGHWITISKDEYIDLQRKALSGNEDRLAALEKKIDELKGK